MGSFDMSKAAAIITTSPNPILDVLGTSFGVPTCMLDMAKTVMNSFPSSVLDGFMAGIQSGKDKADEVVKDITRKIFLDTGIIEYDTNLGRFVWVGSSSAEGVDGAGTQGMENLFGLGEILGIGAQAWMIGETLMGQIDTIKNCIDQLGSFNALQKGNSGMADKYVGFTAVDPVTGEEIPFQPPPPPAEAASLVYAANKSQLEVATGFSRKCTEKIKEISEIQLNRLNDPENYPEPVFNADARNASGVSLKDLLSGTTFRVETSGEFFDDTEFNPYVDIITLSGLQAPLAKNGQFFFSKTGMYYDAYGGGLDFPENDITSIVSAIYFDDDGVAIPGTGVPKNSLKWMFDYNPNIGGKGTVVSLKTYNEWANTVFDINIIDESPNMKEYYDNDHFLQVLLDQRNKEIYDVSGYLTEMLNSGYTEDSVSYINQQQNLYSVISSHNNKIDKRKKQIQAVVVLSPDDRKVSPGHIPINDFSVLEGSKVYIERNRQENLMFNPGDVSGTVLPISPAYINSNPEVGSFVINELVVGNVGKGGILDSAKSFSGVEPTILSLDDHIATSGLVGVFNFLDADIVPPDSEKYLTINCATSGANQKPAQLVASSIDSMFPSGLGIPYFRGVCNFFGGLDGNPKASRYLDNDQYLYSPYRPYGYGRLKGGYDDIDSLFYKKSGFSFSTWLHVPDLGDESGEGWNADNSTSALHRVILGCENRGGDASSMDTDLVVGPLKGPQTVKGLLLGFTRDRRLAQNAAPSNDPAKNSIDDGLVFYMAPTQSINTSAITFLSVSANSAFCEHDKINTDKDYYGMFVDTSSTINNQQFNDCSSSFKMATVSVSYSDNRVRVYLNNTLMKEQTIQATFGQNQVTPPQIPGILDSSSFSYTNTYSDSLDRVPPRFPPDALGQQDFWHWDGPQAGGGRIPITPWIIGGGYTDGMTSDTFDWYTPGTNDGMNFLGGHWGGKKSGLCGFLGSLKLYNRELSLTEIAKTYNAQKGFFENILC